MTRDPIVAQVHEVRKKLLEECGGDLNKLIERSRAREAQHRDRIMTLEMFRERYGKKEASPDVSSR